MTNEIEDGMGFSGLVESAEERRASKKMDADKVRRILRQSQVYSAMRLVDLVNGNNVRKGTGVTEEDMLTQVELAIAKVKTERELLRLLHDWFLQQAPEHYKGCGLYIDVSAAIS